MPLKLISNTTRYLTATNNPWMGVDTPTIEYPGMAICISITCLINDNGQLKLAGAHFTGLGSTVDRMANDLAEFSQIATHAQEVYVAGWLANWAPGHVKNRSGLAYVAAGGGGTLLTELRRVLNYQGAINVFDLANLPPANEFDLRATIIGPAVQFYYSGVQPFPAAGWQQYHAALAPVPLPPPPPVIAVAAAAANQPQRCRCTII